MPTKMDSIKIVYRGADFLIISKPSGLLVHHSRRNGVLDKSSGEALTDWLVANFPEVKNVGDDPGERPGIVHRLDKDTSGLMIVPLNQITFEYFKSAFKAHAVRKEYRAVVWGVPSPRVGKIEKPIGIKDGTIKRTVHKGKMMKEAITEYSTLKESEIDGQEISLLALSPLTGRTHQLRVHLRSINCPILGDSIYGKKTDFSSRLMLHAFAIEFSAPSGEGMRIEDELPESFLTIG